MKKNTNNNGVMAKVGNTTKTVLKGAGKCAVAGGLVLAACCVAYSEYDSDVEAAKNAMDEFYRIHRIYNIYSYKVNYPVSYKELIKRCSDTWNRLNGAQQQKLIKRCGETEADGRMKVEQYLDFITQLKNNNGRQYGRI